MWSSILKYNRIKYNKYMLNYNKKKEQLQQQKKKPTL